MSAITKTKKLQRLDLPVGLLVANSMNPNRMSDTEFNLLYDNMEKTGLTDPILVRRLPDGTYRVVGGHHRLDVAKLLGFEEVPCTVIDDPEFDDDQEKFQLVRMNTIRGKMTPEKFIKLYESLAPKYSNEILRDAFGFADEQEFKRLLKTVQESLPSEMKEIFKDASENIKTVDDLARVLNTMYSKYGDSLPYGYMVLDFGGKDSVWLRMEDPTKKAVLQVGQICRESKRTMDDLLGGLIRWAAEHPDDPLVLQLIAAGKDVKIPEGTITLPTAEFLDQL